MKICDHKSVGIFVWKDGKLLLIERKKFPPGFAVPAGHVDEDTSFEDAARRELKEEVGLDVVTLEQIYEGKHENPCRREDGTWHYWKLYKAEVTGELVRSEEETKQAGWYAKEEFEKLSLEPIMRDLFTAIKVL